jgi:hypothetical protein
MSTIHQSLLDKMRALLAKTRENCCTERDHEDRGDAAIESSTPSPSSPASVSALVSPVVAPSQLIFLTCVGVSASSDIGGCR